MDVTLIPRPDRIKIYEYVMRREDLNWCTLFSVNNLHAFLEFIFGNGSTEIVLDEHFVHINVITARRTDERCIQIAAINIIGVIPVQKYHMLPA